MPACSGRAYRIRTPCGPGKPWITFCCVTRAGPVDEGFFFAFFAIAENCPPLCEPAPGPMLPGAGVQHLSLSTFCRPQLVLRVVARTAPQAR